MYTGNNPVNNSDDSGQGLLKNAIKWVAKSVIKPAIKKIENKMNLRKNKTQTTGVNFSAAFGADISFSFGFTRDNKGNLGVVCTGCVGGGTPSASISAYKTITSAPNIYKQKGLSTQIGGSFSIKDISIGAEYVYFQDKDDAYHGITFLCGIGIPGVSVEIHGEEGFSVVYGFNTFDVLRGFYIKIMEW